MLRLLYRIVLNLGVWPATLLLTLRARRQGDAAGRWPERLGWVRRMERPIAVWVHAASLGEVVAARPLIDALVARHGEGSIWITTMTTSKVPAKRNVRHVSCRPLLPDRLPSMKSATMATARETVRVTPMSATEKVCIRTAWASITSLTAAATKVRTGAGTGSAVAS
ncbi:MAG: hypothetical protein NXI11_09905, partial [Proteobacteria bacterium]|nr:hypothetical protein [Pseudomonadota bacterium]